MNIFVQDFAKDYCERHGIDIEKLKPVNVSPLIMEFDPKTEYSWGDEPHKPMYGSTHRIQMGRIVNLITRMAMRGATELELIAAVRHSMVVIDAMKHDLNWKKSLKDHNIQYFEKKYPKTEVN